MRDARIALALLAALAILVRRSNDPASALRHMAATFFIVSFALWQWEFSIFRYLSALELLSGPLLATAAIAVGPRVGPAVLLALAILLLAVLRFSTVDPNWGRIGRQGGHPLVVHVPRLPDDSVVLILDNAPLAYVAVFEPPRIRFLGVNNNLTRPRDGGLLQSRIRAIVGSHPTHLYGLEKPDFAPGMADDALHAYRLQRRRCVLVTGAIVGTETRLCALAPTSSL